MILDRVLEHGIQIWTEDGALKVRTPKPLLPEQRAFLKLHKPELIDELTTQRGDRQRYLWRRINSYNVAGWHVLYSHLELDEVQTMLGADVEIRLAMH